MITTQCVAEIILNHYLSLIKVSTCVNKIDAELSLLSLSPSVHCVHTVTEWPIENRYLIKVWNSKALLLHHSIILLLLLY